MYIKDIIKSRKSYAIIFRINEKGNAELLAFTFGYPQYKYYRVPGGNMQPHEDHYRGMLREIKEETNLRNLVFMRRIGEIEYFKPFNNKDVQRADFLFYCHDKTSRTWEYIETNNKEKYFYKWLKIKEYAKLDPEVGVFLNPYHVPELFIQDHNFGLPRGKLIIKNYNPLWALFYKYEIFNIMFNIKNQDFIYEHIGSTAVKGLSAKPIVDICIGINKYRDFFPYVKKMENIGYQYRGEYGIPKRHYFVKSDLRFYHVHVFEKRSQEWKSHIKFRNMLLKNKKLRSDYDRIKKKLVAHHVSREDYQKIKGDFINKVL
jgi:GrpB-like predicted nucleotidyltransferase (UPF0157 family)/8-oxo-dGTP pyrophosphatase MutT (NUDIX family)